MTRKIKSQEVKPGMTIEWTNGGWKHSGTIAKVQAVNSTSLFFAFATAEGVWQTTELDQKVTVLREAQPDEPTAFGACVEAGGVWFVRLDVRAFEDSDFQPWQSESLIQCTWAEVCEQGPVTIINADPFTTTAQDETEPRVWGRWADVPEMTPVLASGIIPPYRKVGNRIECKRGGSWGPAFAGAYDLNKFSPFTEVLPGA